MATKTMLAVVLMLCCATASLAWECYGDGDCHSSNPCLTPKCNKGKCEFWDKNDGCDCDDGNACTIGDKCYKGHCTPGKAKKCSTKNQCKYATCNPHSGHCEEKCKPDGTGCNDRNKCTYHDKCYSGECKGTWKSCPNKGPCYKNYCNPLTGKCKCDKLADGTKCDDGKHNTYDDKCRNGVCKGTPKYG